MSNECSHLGVYMDKDYSFRQQLIAIGTILVVLCLPTIALNFLIWITIIAKRHLHHPSYMIIANLALSDWLGGCISFPTYAAICFTQSASKDPCFISSVTTPIGYVLGISTFLIISFQAVERFVAVFYPFQYRRQVTKSLVIIISLTIWLISSGVVAFWMLSRKTQEFNILVGTMTFTFTAVDILCYYKIYAKTSKIEKQIKDQAKSSGGAKESRPKFESKVARVTALMMINAFVCHTPQVGSCLYRSLSSEKSPESHHFLYWSWLLALMNSVINPLIAYMQLSVIRKAVFSKVSIFGNHFNRVEPL